MISGGTEKETFITFLEVLHSGMKQKNPNFLPTEILYEGLWAIFFNETFWWFKGRVYWHFYKFPSSYSFLSISGILILLLFLIYYYRIWKFIIAKFENHFPFD